MFIFCLTALECRLPECRNLVRFVHHHPPPKQPRTAAGTQMVFSKVSLKVWGHECGFWSALSLP